ncbi:hypothetical protein KC19_11G121100 [Ceratodon purpureus]|uniref:Myb-like domain-containing protein n=1 Tax=Ceratodon purpureus TaxID=3225 RepID=A0A8T0GG87_CERPU|nr:hypothetical protein KC19_11G121100 [Ceratodon purpureus]
MQNSGQYGVSDAPQYVVGRQAAPPHIFSISHDNISIAPPAAHALHAQQHHLPHHLQAQHHHYGPHPGHQPHPSLQQIHQTQHPQFPLPQHPSQQQQPQQSAQDVQQQHQHQQVHQQQQQAQQQAREAQQAREQQQAREAQQAREQQQREQQQREQQQREQQQREQQQREQQQQQLAQQQAAAQQAMVQQLGLGGPDSPEVPSPGVSRPSPTKYNNQQLVVVAQDDDGLEEEGRSTGGNRWPRQETLALIKIRSEMDANFRDSGLKGPLWEEVSRKLAEQGFQRSAKKCKEKFENVHKYYKKTKDGKAGRQDGKSYRFFSQLEALYGGQQASAAQLDHTDTAAAASLLTGSAVPGRAAGEDYNGLSAQRQSEVSTEVTLSESMSEDDYDEPESGTGGADNQGAKNSKKRKRGAGGSKAEFFESLMKNLVEKQEGMQQKFLEFMERREQERQARDESWRRQEMARVAREHELRVQEQQLAVTRDAALVAFLQKVTGQTLTLPQIPTPSPTPIIPPSIDSVVTPSVLKPHNPHPTVVTPTQPAPTSQQLVTVVNADTDPDRDSPIDPNSKRWPKPEVLTLIKLRSDMEPRFQEAGLKGPLWEEISQGMACLGYNRNQKRCKEKWENINKYFRKTKESNKKRPENAKTCPYFHQLEILYLSGKLGTPHNKQVAKVASADEKATPQNVDHHAVPLAQRIEAAATQGAGNDGDMLMKMLPAAAEAVQNAAASSGNGSSGANAGHLFSSPDNGSSGGTKAHVSEASI